MTDERFFDRTGRKIIVTGHYGSGKTEFSVSLALLLAARQPPSGDQNPAPVTLIDLDIVNPYFRSRERRDLLEEAGVAVYGNSFNKDITIEIPAFGASLRAPLEDNRYRVIIDAGGNDSGALILNQFSKYFKDEDPTIVAIINVSRPETRSPDGAIEHIQAIEAITGLSISAIVNNSHLLRDTTADVVIKGHELCMDICEATGKRLLCDCYPEGIVDPAMLSGLSGNLMPLGMYMRPTWLDK